MKLFSSKWASAVFGLILAVGFLPDIASGQARITSGTATHVGGVPVDGEGDGQVNISGTIPLPSGVSPDLTKCTLTITHILSNGGVELVKDDPSVGACVGEPPWFNVPLEPRRGSKKNDAIFESDQRGRSTLRLQIKNRGRGELEFSSGLKISRACINAGPFDTNACDADPPQVFPLGTSFALTCPEGIIPFNNAPFWRTTDFSGGDNVPLGCNIRTP